MVRYLLVLLFLIALGFDSNAQALSDSTNTQKEILDVVWLKGGSRLTGKIIKWDLGRGMEFQLATGATMDIPKSEIIKVYQDVTLQSAISTSATVVRTPRPYEFREQGTYYTFSGFLNVSDPGGAGLGFSVGRRFNRMFGVGVGLGIETNDFFNGRDIVPIFAEARGFFKAAKISPYYAMKIGYGFAVNHAYESAEEGQGGIYISPELGVRFGGKNVNYYLGVEYKLQKASYDNAFWDGSSNEKITYRRIELRTGIVF